MAAQRGDFVGFLVVSCPKPEFKERFLAFLSHSLGDSEREVVTNHFRDCNDCAQELKDLRLVHDLLVEGVKKNPGRRPCPPGELLYLYATGGEALGISSQQAIMSHLEGCRSCRTALEVLQESDIALMKGGVPSRTLDPGSAAGRRGEADARSIEADLRDAQEAKPRRWRLLKLALGATVAVAIVTVAWIMIHRATQEELIRDTVAAFNELDEETFRSGVRKGTGTVEEPAVKKRWSDTIKDLTMDEEQLIYAGWASEGRIGEGMNGLLFVRTLDGLSPADKEEVLTVVEQENKRRHQLFIQFAREERSSTVDLSIIAAGYSRFRTEEAPVDTWIEVAPNEWIQKR